MSRNLFTGIDRLCSNNLPWQLDEKLRWELSLKLGFPAEDLQYHPHPTGATMRPTERGERYFTDALVDHLSHQVVISAVHYHQALESLEIVDLLDDTLDQPEDP